MNMNQESRGGEEGGGGGSTVKGNNERGSRGSKKRGGRNWRNERKRARSANIEELLWSVRKPQRMYSSQFGSNIIIVWGEDQCIHQ